MDNVMGYHAEESFLEAWTAVPADNLKRQPKSWLTLKRFSKTIL
jgi:hypothetical protein